MKFSVKKRLVSAEGATSYEVTVVEAEAFSVRDDGVLILRDKDRKAVGSFNKDQWSSCTPESVG